MAKNLIIYYSRKGENYVNGNIESLQRETQKSVQNTSRKRWEEISLKSKP